MNFHLIKPEIYRNLAGKYVAIIITLLLLSSCASTVANPLFINPKLEADALKLTEQTLPLSIKVSLDSYLSENDAVYFFVSNDGGHTTAWHCVEKYCDYDGLDEFAAAKKHCEILRLGMKCTLLYIRRAPLVENINFADQLTSLLNKGDTTIPADEAVGKIIYMPGFSGWSSAGYNFTSALTDDSISPILSKLESFGWDVDVLNILHLDRAYLSERDDLYKKLLSELIDSARAEGYKKVVLYGGSRGGAEIMNSILAGVNPDAIVLMEPDWHGPKYDSRGKFNLDHNVRAEEIKSLLAKQKVNRIVFSFFKNSRWYADFTREEIDETLGSLGNQYLLIGAPVDLEGHGGSWTDRFSNMYATCLHQFLTEEIDSESECQPPKLDNTQYQNWATNKWIKEGDFKKLSGSEIIDYMKGKALCSYDPTDETQSKYSCQIWKQSSRQKGFLNEFGDLILSDDIVDLKADGFCRHNGLYSPTYRCAEFYLIEDDIVAITPDDRNSFYWYHRVDESEVKKIFEEVSFHCKNKSKFDSVNCEAR